MAFRDTGDFTDHIVAQLLEAAGVQSDFDGALPKGVSANSRTDGERVFVFLQNNTYEPQQTQTGKNWKNLETGETVTGQIDLQPLETRILVGE